VAGVLLPVLFHQAGVGPLGLAAFAAAPLLGGLLALQLSPLIRASAQRVTAVKAGCAALFCVLPWLSPTAGLLLWCAVTVVGAICSPLQHQIWGLLYARERRTQYIALARLIGTGVSLATTAGGSRLAEAWGGLTVVALAGLCGAVCCAGYLAVPFQVPEESRRLSASIHTIRDFWRHRGLRPLLNAHLLWGLGFSAAGPLYTLRQVDAYHLSLSQVGLLSALGTVTGALSGPLWGRLADHRHGALVMAGGALSITVCPWCYVWHVPPVWLGLGAVGMASGMGALDLGLSAVLSDTVRLPERPQYSAAWSAVTGARGLLAPVLSGLVVQVGLMSAQQLLAVCGLIMLAGSAAYVLVVLRAEEDRFTQIPAGEYRAVATA